MMGPIPRRGSGMAAAGVDAEQIERWLAMLRAGTISEKLWARRGLAYVFEQRGMVAEATELLEANVANGGRSPQTLRWLARLYRAQGEFERAVAAEAAASRHRSGLTTALTIRMCPAAGAVTTAPQEAWTVGGLVPYFAFLVALGGALGAGVWFMLPVVGAIAGR
jgi:hypothetical protein